jgi:prepilin-type N-terminal cleavage/methylation domain-containing protein
MRAAPKIAAQPGSGFSLMEVIVVIVVVSIIFSVGAMILGRGFGAYFGGENITEQDWQARVAFERMTRDLRDAHRNLSVAISGAAPSMAIHFSAYDPATDAITSVNYALSGTTLQRNGIALADNVNLLEFALLQSNGATAPQASLAYYIQVTARVQASGPQGDYNLTFRDTINPRNFP